MVSHSVFSDNQLNVLPYNRVVKDLNGLSEDEFLEKVKELVELTVSDHEPADAVNNTKMYISGSGITSNGIKLMMTLFIHWMLVFYKIFYWHLY